ncbi:Zinc metalloproteinase nas-1, partial [Trichostrongylus colubriformis]
NDMVFYNALKNKQLVWKDGIIPYVMDAAFLPHEVKIIEKAFASYRKSTCIRFQPRTAEQDYLNIVKGYGCYSQVGRTGGKQEISLGRGCLFHEIIVHELMHSVGFWHEHSRADRDDHIHIRWENILPGMKAQFDKISAALQDTQGEKYDYRSIMHYDSTAFSRNGKNTIETVVEGFTDIIGSSVDLSELDIVKVCFKVI